MAMTTSAARTAGSPLEIARALAPGIRARAEEIEAARQLPRDLVLDIANAGTAGSPARQRAPAGARCRTSR